MTRLRWRVLVPMAVVTLALLGGARPAAAHPLGNFTTNVYAGLRFEPGRLVVDYVVDLAEIPTVQAEDDIDGDGNGSTSPEEERRYAEGECASLAADLDLDIAGAAVELSAADSKVGFPPGQAGLSLLRLECRIEGRFAPLTGDVAVTFQDRNLVDRIGWREVTAVGDRTTLVRSDVPTESVSSALTAYPEDRLSSPLRQRSASLTVRAGGPAADALSDEALGPFRGPVDTFSSLVARNDLTLPFALLALAVAFGLGALHALAPGHGKTVIAAYVVGQRGSLRQALTLAGTVAVTHTGGVLALALVATNSSVAPDRLYPWLAGASGLMVMVIGSALVVRALRFDHVALAFGAHGHHHGPGHDHPSGHHHGHHHGHHDGRDHGHHDGSDDHSAHPEPATDGQRPPSAIRARSLVAMGFAGGLVPSPSALVVLIGAIALGRAWFGLVLITTYGLGLAATLVGAGLLLNRARARLERIFNRDRRPRLTWLASALPLGTAVLVLLGGVLMTVRATGI